MRSPSLYTGLNMKTSLRWLAPEYGSLLAKMSPGCTSSPKWSRHPLRAGMVAPRCTGRARPWATRRPSPSQTDVEKSRLFLTTVEREVRTTVRIMLSATVTSPL